MCTGWRHWSLRHLYMTSPRYPRWSRGCCKDRVKHFVILVGINGDEPRVFYKLLSFLTMCCIIWLVWNCMYNQRDRLPLLEASFSSFHERIVANSHFLNYSRVLTFSAYIYRQYSFLWNWSKSARWLMALPTEGPIRFALGLTSCVRHHIDDESRISDCDSPSTSFCDQTFDVYGNGPVHLIMFSNDRQRYL